MSLKRKYRLTFLGLDGDTGSQNGEATWTLELVEGEWVVTDDDGNIVFAFPADDLYKRISFPSFWASSKHVGIIEVVKKSKSARIYCFAPDQALIAGLRSHIRASEERNPEESARHHRRSGLTMLTFGGFFLLCGLAVLLADIFGGDIGEKITVAGELGFLMVAFLGGIAFSVFGVKGLLRAGQLSRLAAKAEDAEEEEPKAKKGRRPRQE